MRNGCYVSVVFGMLFGFYEVGALGKYVRLFGWEEKGAVNLAMAVCFWRLLKVTLLNCLL